MNNPLYKEQIARTELSIWLLTHEDRELKRQAMGYGDRVGNPSAGFAEYERLMIEKYHKEKRSRWWRRLLGRS